MQIKQPQEHNIWTYMFEIYRGPAPFHQSTPNKRFEPVFSTVIMAMCSLFNRMLLLTNLIRLHLIYCGQTMMIGCNHTSFEWTRAVRHIYGIIRHMQGLYSVFHLVMQSVMSLCKGMYFMCMSLWHLPMDVYKYF